MMCFYSTTRKGITPISLIDLVLNWKIVHFANTFTRTLRPISHFLTLNDDAHLCFKLVSKNPTASFDVYVKMDFKDYTVFLFILWAQISSRT